MSEAATMRIAQCVHKTLSHQTSERQEAEKALEAMQTEAGFSVQLLQIVGTASIPEQTRHAAAILFKNLTKKYWSPSGLDESKKIRDEDKQLIKQHIVNLMLDSPKSIKAQLSAALETISSSDFPLLWPNLLQELVSKFSCGDFGKIQGVLATADSIFLRYRHAFKSKELWTEIKLVLDQFAKPLTHLFEAVCEQLKSAQGGEAIQQVLEVLNLLVSIFTSLNSQDLPEFFEDNMQGWMDRFLALLKYSNAQISVHKEEAGVLEKLKTSVVEAVVLYVGKYEEEFKIHIGAFVETIWHLLTTLSTDGCYDELVGAGIQFLTKVVEQNWNSSLFSNEDTMKQICEKIIIPNIRLREVDVNLFEWNGLEYVRRDMEGSDAYTRRKMTIDLVKGLCKHFEKQITGILFQYVNVLMTEFAQNKEKNWQAKDAAMYLILALVVQGATEKAGVTQLNNAVDILQFFQEHILPELSDDDIAKNPVLKADCIKYVTTFRRQLPKESYPTLISAISKFLASDEFVVHTYAAVAVEQLMSFKEENGDTRLTRAQLKPMVTPLFSRLLKTLEHSESTDNDYVMKTIMMLCAHAEGDLVEVAESALNSLTAILRVTSKNPRNPNFNHFLFESIAALIRGVCKAKPEAVDSFQNALFPPFQEVLAMECRDEFGPYVFQIMSLLLRSRPDISPPYQMLLPSLVMPVMWETSGFITAISNLLVSYLSKRASVMVETGNLDKLLGVFQKLLCSKANDHHAFSIMRALVLFLPMGTLQPFLKDIFRVMLDRLRSSKTQQYSCQFLVFLALFSGKHGFETLEAVLESMQPGLTAMILEKVWLANVPLIQTDLDCKIVAVGTINLLTKSNVFASKPAYANMSAHFLKAIIDVFVTPADPTSDNPLELLESGGFESQYARLAFANEPIMDPFSDIKDTKAYFAAAVHSSQAKFGSLAAALPDTHKKHLQKLVTEV